MDNMYSQSLSSISFANSVVKQNKAWLNRSGVSEQANQKAANANYVINAMSEQQSNMAWRKKSKNKEYLRLRINNFKMSQGSAKNE